MNTPSSLADACEAHYPGDYPAVTPHDVQNATPFSLVACYRCWCGREWKCWWDARSAGWPASREEAA